jgi:hypothetical protein
MKLVGFNVTKVNAEKFSSNFKELKIENNIKIEDILEANSDFFKKEEAVLNISFNYILNYNPKIAIFSFSGNLLFLTNQKDAKEILNQWKDKKISEELKLPLFNFILRKITIKALDLEEELDLPLHINIPFINKQKKAK